MYLKKRFYAIWSAVKLTKWKIVLAVLFILISSIFNSVVGNYSDNRPSMKASDIILDNIPSLSAQAIFVWFWLLVFAMLYVYPFFYKPEKVYYYWSMFSILLAVRAGFIFLTNLESPLGSISPEFPDFLHSLVFPNALFFSGHTSYPFLGFLMFKKSKIRWFFLASSIILGFSTLLMHLHYSIDVFAAFFITYGIYKIGENLSKKYNL